MACGCPGGQPAHVPGACEEFEAVQGAISPSKRWVVSVIVSFHVLTPAAQEGVRNRQDVVWSGWFWVG